MFSESAEIYDLIYATKKDYEKEARQVASLIREVHPDARSVLDVACGTGEHARILSRDHGYEVDGVDIEPGFVEIAKRKNPSGTFRQSDMTTMALSKRYDVVLCLFSSIGYVRTLENMTKTLVQFSAHLADGGVVMVEPWFRPGQLEHARVLMTTVESEDITVCRMSHMEIEDRLSRITFEYLIGKRSGITRSREIHELGLFTVEEMTACFEEAGFSAHFDEEGLYGRGLFIARKVE